MWPQWRSPQAPCGAGRGGRAERSTDLRTVGVAYDGSAEAHAAACLARDLAETAGARLRVLRVLEDAEAPTEQAHEQLDDLLAELGDIATGELVIGDPVTKLAAAASELDLLVTGSRGCGPVRRVMLGSTSDKLLHHAACPVLVLPRTALDRLTPCFATPGRGRSPDALEPSARFDGWTQSRSSHVDQDRHGQTRSPGCRDASAGRQTRALPDRRRPPLSRR